MISGTYSGLIGMNLVLLVLTLGLLDAAVLWLFRGSRFGGGGDDS